MGDEPRVAPMPNVGTPPVNRVPTTVDRKLVTNLSGSGPRYQTGDRQRSDRTNPMRFPLRALASFFTLANCLAAQTGLPTAREPEKVGMDSGKLNAAVAAFRKAVQADVVKGAVLLVARSGKVVLHEAVGVRDLKGEIPMRRDTQFRMASNTKPVTATAIMMLVEQGKLRLDAAVADYIPAWKKGEAAKITIRQLLTHTSGLRISTLFLYPLMTPSKAHPDAPNLRLEVERFGAVGPAVEPGTSYSYSNPGFNTLAALVEIASGIPFAAFVKANIYDPLGMKDSGHREAEADQGRMSTVFRKTDGVWQVRWQPGDGNKLPFVRGSGGMVSTAADYSRLCQMFLREGTWGGARVLTAKSVNEMTRRQVDHIPAARRYGLGWAIRDDSGGFMHSGSDGTWVAVDPELDLMCLVLTQSQRAARAPAGKFFREVRAAVLPRERPNILMITADDLNRSSVGVYGCRVAGVTPHIDKLAASGIRFNHGHVNIAVCQPSRAVMLTGRYPHHSGARGFEPIQRGVPTLSGVLRDNGYLTGIFGKTRHVKPDASFRWDVSVPRAALGEGRSEARYGSAARTFFARAKKAGQPFFLMANSHDPHRPFAGSAQEARQSRRQKKVFPPAPRTFGQDEVSVPGFLPDLGPVRKEVAQYFSSVHRCDRVVGRLLKELDAAGLAENTIVLFLSDNGMAVPFAKTNVYLHSTATPWIMRWPGRIEAGQVDRKHFVSTVDWMPTALDAVGLPQPEKLDGRSFFPLLRGETQRGRGAVFTSFYKTSARKAYPMRAVQTARYGYIVNDWADGQTRFRNESMAGLTFKAMRAAAASDGDVAARVKHFLFRTREELYDFSADPDALHNLAGRPEHADVLRDMRSRLAAGLRTQGDPEAKRFRPVPVPRRR